MYWGCPAKSQIATVILSLRIFEDFISIPIVEEISVLIGSIVVASRAAIVVVCLNC